MVASVTLKVVCSLLLTITAFTLLSAEVSAWVAVTSGAGPKAPIAANSKDTTCIRRQKATPLPNLHTTRNSRSSITLYDQTQNDNENKSNTNSGKEDTMMDLESGEIYSNPLTAFLGNFLPSGSSTSEKSETEESSVDLGPFTDEWDKPKRLGLSTDEMISILENGLKERQWFVTGNAMPELFSDDFYFKDPDVQLRGIQKYCEGVRRLFDQDTSVAGIIDVYYNEELSEQASDESSEVITVKWRLSGKVNIGPFGGLTIKPYICYSDLYRRNKNGLIYFQEDRFDIPSWDLLLSFFAPWLPFLAPPAPEVDDILKQRQKQ